MDYVSTPISDIIEVCLLAGRVILQSGGETYPVEDLSVALAYALLLDVQKPRPLTLSGFKSFRRLLPVAFLP